VGSAALAELGEGVVIATDLHGLSSGKYSISLHSVGGCDLVLPSNRTRQLPIEIDGSKGFGTTIKGATLDNGTNGLLGTNGGTVVVENNTGGRVACGLLK
jgi:Cu/Zn superoxide dismutase